MALYNPSAGQTDWRKTLQQSMQQPGAISQGGQVAGLGGSYGQQPQARSATVTQPQGSGTPYNAAASPTATFNNPDNNNWGMTPDPNQTAPQMYPGANGGGGGYFSDGSSYGGGGWASGFTPGNGQNPTMTQDQYGQYQQNYTQNWASNSLIAPEQTGAFGEDAHAWSVAYQQRASQMGYPPGSYGQVTRNRGVDWISPDGVGPNGEVGHYVSFGPSGSVDPRTGIDWSINKEAGMHDWEMTPEQFVQYHGDWVQAYAKDPAALQAALNDPEDPIWQHIDPADLQAAIALVGNGGTGGPGGSNDGIPGNDQDPTVVQDNSNGNGNGRRNRGRRGGRHNGGGNGGRNGGRNNGPHGGSGYGPGGAYGPGGGRPNGGGRGGNGGGGGNNNRNNNNNKGGNNKGGGKNNKKK